MTSLVHPRERTLGAITLVLGLLLWALLILGTLGVALIYVLFGFIGYLFAQSAFVSYIECNAVRLSADQCPDLYARYQTCCAKLGLSQEPAVYLLQGGGLLNAFALRFLGRNYVVLLSDVVDAVEAQPDGVQFYMGHELAHIVRGHLTGHLWRLPVLWLPLLGAAYARAKESTCDLFGRACCDTPEQAARAMLVLAAGAERWRTANLTAYVQQAQASRGFWASFHELIGGYPWLTKRVARVLDPQAAQPGRHPLAYVLAAFVPYGGRMGGAGGFMIVAATIGILAAVAIPQYQQYKLKVAADMAAEASHSAWLASASTRDGLARHYFEHDETVPDTLQEAGLAEALPDGTRMAYRSDNMSLVLHTASGDLVTWPIKTEQPGTLRWLCQAGEGLPQAAVPDECKEPAEE